MRASRESHRVPGLCNLSLGPLRQTLCAHVCANICTHTHTETHLAQHQCSPRVVIEGAFEWKTISAVVAASTWPALPSGSRGRIGQAYSFHGLVWWGSSLPRGPWAQGRGGQGQGVVAWPSHTCPTLSLSLLPAPECCLFTARCWCQFTLRGHRTKAHAGSSRFRMRIINLTSCKDRSQCRGRAINPTSCSGALQGKGEGGWGLEAFFFLPQICGNRFYSRLLHKERERGENILV